jgi:iron complex transport system ATP-binding protein
VLPDGRDTMRAAIDIRDVTVEFEGKKALQGVSWRAQRGESWAVVGPNGAGKTTLMSMINGYRWPSSGTMKVLGQTFGECDLRELRTRIGLVSSFLEGWVGSDERVLDIVVSGKYGATRLWNKATAQEKKRATSLLKVLGCEEYATRRSGELSQGERQRVMLARTLMADAELLILDEPCEGLDLGAREKFLGGLTRLADARFVTMVYITHRTDEIPSSFTHAMLLKGGRVMAAGKIETTLTDLNMSECFGLPVRIERLGGRYYTLVA